MDNDPRTTEELKAEATRRMEEYAGTLRFDIRDGIVSMTDATEAVWGSSGRGNPKAVRIIETLEEYGYVSIKKQGRARWVRLTAKGLEAPLPEGIVELGITPRFAK